MCSRKVSTTGQCVTLIKWYRYGTDCNPRLALALRKGCGQDRRNHESYNQIKRSMDSRIVTKSVSFTVTDQEGTEERKYGVSLSSNESENEVKDLWVFANEQQINFPLEDVPLLVQALKEFC